MKISAVLGLLCMFLLLVAPTEASKHGSNSAHSQLHSRAAFTEFVAKNPQLFKFPLGRPKGKTNHVGTASTHHKKPKAHAVGEDSDSVAHLGVRPGSKPAPRPVPKPASKPVSVRPSYGSRSNSWNAQVAKPSSSGRTQVRRGRDTTNVGDKPAGSSSRYSNNAGRKPADAPAKPADSSRRSSNNVGRKPSDHSSKPADSSRSYSSTARKSADDSSKPAGDASTASPYASKAADFDSKPAD